MRSCFGIGLIAGLSLREARLSYLLFYILRIRGIWVIILQLLVNFIKAFNLLSIFNWGRRLVNGWYLVNFVWFNLCHVSFHLDIIGTGLVRYLGTQNWITRRLFHFSLGSFILGFQVLWSFRILSFFPYVSLFWLVLFLFSFWFFCFLAFLTPLSSWGLSNSRTIFVLSRYLLLFRPRWSSYSRFYLLRWPIVISVMLFQS